MRRFVAFLLSSVSILIGVGVSFKPIATSINADLSYRNGKEITLKLSDRESSTGKSLADDPDAAENYSKIVDTRLTNYGVSDYKIFTSGNDTITVKLTAKNETEYTHIGNLLSVNPKIELATTKDEGSIVDDEKSSFWHTTTAYVESSGNDTVLIKPIPSTITEKMNELIKKAEEIEKDDPKPKSALNDDQPAKKSIVLWLNRNLEHGETYEKKTDTNVAKKIIHEFNSKEFFVDDKKEAFKITFTAGGSERTKIQNAYDDAVYHMNLLNASETSYDCSVIRSVDIPASVENLIIYTDHANIAISASFISLIIAFIMISLILALFYKLGAIAIVSTASLHTFLTLVIFNLFKTSFNISAFVGFILVALTSVLIGVLYNHYLHEEMYKGRSLKKANLEASKKTTLITIDVSVISIVFGIILYFVGGKAIGSVGVLLIISSVLNLFINTFVLKGLMWLLTNSTSLQNKYSYFNVNSKYIPNIAKEEKPSYVGPFEKTNFKKNKKVLAIVFSSLTLASILGISIFAGTTKTMFNQGNLYQSQNQVILKITRQEDAEANVPSEEEFKNILKDVKNTKTKQSFTYSDLERYYYRYKDSTVGSNLYYKDFYFVFNITEKDYKEPIYSYNDKTDVDLSSALGNAFTPFSKDEVIIRTYELYNVTSNAGVILGATILSSFVVTVYLWIRYRASRAFASFVIVSSASLIGLGFAVLTRLVALPTMGVGVVIPSLVATFILLMIMNKDKETISQERIRDLATRSSVLDKSCKVLLYPGAVFGFASLYLCVNFAGFAANVYSTLFIFAAVGVLAALILIATLYTPLCDFLEEQFSKVKFPEIKRKKKKKVVNKSSEHTEAIFIGIND